MSAYDELNSGEQAVRYRALTEAAELAIREAGQLVGTDLGLDPLVHVANQILDLRDDAPDAE